VNPDHCGGVSDAGYNVRVVLLVQKPGRAPGGSCGRKQSIAANAPEEDLMRACGRVEAARLPFVLAAFAPSTTFPLDNQSVYVAKVLL
jgi:hypothetical protein